MTNLWLELQDARKIIAILKKHPHFKLDEAISGYTCLVDDNNFIIYEAKSYEGDRTIFYAVECFKNKLEPNAIDLNNYDGVD